MTTPTPDTLAAREIAEELCLLGIKSSYFKDRPGLAAYNGIVETCELIISRHRSSRELESIAAACKLALRIEELEKALGDAEVMLRASRPRLVASGATMEVFDACVEQTQRVLALNHKESQPCNSRRESSLDCSPSSSSSDSSAKSAVTTTDASADSSSLSEQVRELRALYDSTTQGEWKARLSHSGDFAGYVDVGRSKRAFEREPICFMAKGSGTADHAFIPTIHNALPTLLDTIERLEGEVEASDRAAQQTEESLTEQLTLATRERDAADEIAVQAQADNEIIARERDEAVKFIQRVAKSCHCTSPSCIAVEAREFLCRVTPPEQEARA